MKNRTDEYLRKLQNLYLLQVRKFVEALKGNASQNELISIRKSSKEVFDEIQKNSITDGSMRKTA